MVFDWNHWKELTENKRRSISFFFSVFLSDKRRHLLTFPSLSLSLSFSFALWCWKKNLCMLFSPLSIGSTERNKDVLIKCFHTLPVLLSSLHRHYIRKHFHQLVRKSTFSSMKSNCQRPEGGNETKPWELLRFNTGLMFRGVWWTSQEIPPANRSD